MNTENDKTSVSFLKRRSHSFEILIYDAIVFVLSSLLVYVLYSSSDILSVSELHIQLALSFSSILIFRFGMSVYRQIWRYGGVQSYIKLMIADAFAFLFYYGIEHFLPISHVAFSRSLSLFCVDLLGALVIRMLYRYAYKCSNNTTKRGKFLSVLLKLVGRSDIKSKGGKDAKKIKIAIVGAGDVGLSLAESLLTATNASYIPRCFIDNDENKIGRQMQGLPIYNENDVTAEMLNELEIQEVVFAIPGLDSGRRFELYNFYKNCGCKVKVYDYLNMESAGSGKRQMREFDIEELLFRKQIVVADERTYAYYNDKVVLITGGGGSIGSELCRQIAKMKAKKLIILDVYENGAYDVQQELRMKYGAELNLCVEIVSVCNRTALERVFEEHKPQIVVMAAAHKHVPLMEKNVIEAVENNVFGTLNTVELSEKYGVERVIMVSTDKAVNPTNVMGATKRMCEMIVLSHSRIPGNNTTFSATRFGNVLGSAGSVIPLFKRQIAHGGPITITDKRIIRYFMTIPEASQLVLQSGAIAKNGELFVLDMGQPVKILDLAENMIRLSGFEPYKDIDIVVTGLRPGEKLYEELLVKSEELDKTDNSLIFIERDSPLDINEIDEKLKLLKEAVNNGSDSEMRAVLAQVVPTFKRPEEVNKNV